MLGKRNLLRILTLLAVLSVASAGWATVSPTDRVVETALQKELSKSFHSVQVRVEDRVATLLGTVKSYQEKLGAERKTRRYGALTSVVNSIQVVGPSVTDRQLAEKLSRKLAYDRNFQGSLFDAFRADVRDGVIAVHGYAHSYPARDSALATAASEKGVKGVVDRIEVLPLSPLDNEIRATAARRIYGAASLQKYALDPAHPIRIIVRNGQLTLEGTVLSPMDRTIAGLAVAGINGVFSVRNHLQVDGCPEND